MRALLLVLLQDAGLEDLAPADKNGISFLRNTDGVLKIVYLGGTTKGGEWCSLPVADGAAALATALHAELCGVDSLRCLVGCLSRNACATHPAPSFTVHVRLLP